MLIGGITVLSNIVGFGRQLVFAHTVSANCLGTAYATANQVPNIVYDIVIGGALTSVLVPVLAVPAARRLTAGRPGPGERPGRGGRGRRDQPDRLGPAQLDGAGARPGQPAHRRAVRPAGLAAAGRRAALQAPGHLHHQRAHAGRVRAADPALRPGRGAVRHPAGAPPVRLARAGPGAVQPGGHRYLRSLRPAQPRLPQPPGPDPHRRAAGAVHRHHGRGGRAGAHRARPGAPAAACGCGPRCASRPAWPAGSAAWPRSGWPR